jgi:DNA-binding transcriptional regulator LsrR (DeoR family)
MRRIREVLRLKFQLGLNDSQVANSAGIARATVQDYLRRIAATGVTLRLTGPDSSNSALSRISWVFLKLCVR